MFIWRTCILLIHCRCIVWLLLLLLLVRVTPSQQATTKKLGKIYLLRRLVVLRCLVTSSSRRLGRNATEELLQRALSSLVA